MKRVIRIGVATACVVSLGWVLVGHLRPLAGLLSSTRSMAATTQAILAGTQSLLAEVDHVQTNMQMLQRQEQLLAEQEELTGQVLAELRQQEALNRQTRQLLVDILTAERTTVELTQAVANASADAMNTVVANGRQLNSLAAATDQTAAGAVAMDSKLDQLLVEMNGSAENFARLGRLKTATKMVAERTTNWWRRLWGRIKG